MCDQQNLRSACAYAQSDQSPCELHEYSMTVKLLTEHFLEFLSLKGGCRGSSESTHVKMPHCWKSHARAQILCVCPYVLVSQHVANKNMKKCYESIKCEYKLESVLNSNKILTSILSRFDSSKW